MQVHPPIPGGGQKDEFQEDWLVQPRVEGESVPEKVDEAPIPGGCPEDEFREDWLVRVEQEAVLEDLAVMQGAKS